jgi:hypothetical protein
MDDHLDDGEPGKLTSDEIDRLKVELSHKSDEIASVIAQTLGYDPAALSDEQREEVNDMTEGACENWDEAETMAFVGRRPTLTVVGSLQQLLREYQQIADVILDIQDGAVLRDLGDDDQ